MLAAVITGSSTLAIYTQLTLVYFICSEIRDLRSENLSLRCAFVGRHRLKVARQDALFESLSYREATYIKYVHKEMCGGVKFVNHRHVPFIQFMIGRCDEITHSGRRMRRWTDWRVREASGIRQINYSRCLLVRFGNIVTSTIPYTHPPNNMADAPKVETALRHDIK